MLKISEDIAQTVHLLAALPDDVLLGLHNVVKERVANAERDMDAIARAMAEAWTLKTEWRLLRQFRNHFTHVIQIHATQLGDLYDHRDQGWEEIIKIAKEIVDSLEAEETIPF